MKKFLSVFVLFLMVFSLLVTKPVKGVSSAISDLKITVTPSDRGAYGEYKITFKVNADLKTGYDRIYLTFPQESTIPCTSCAYAHCTDCFLINGTRVAGAGPLYDIPKTVYFVVPSPGLKAQDTVELLIKQSAGFVNPSIPGTYKLKVWTDAEAEKVEGSFEITSTTLQNLTLKVDPEFTKANLGLYFTFQTGRLGDLSNGQRIYITFPEEFLIPNLDKGKLDFVTINGAMPSEIKNEGNTLSFRISESIGKNTLVKVNIYPSFGILSPKIAGSYKFYVWTDTEPTKVEVITSVKDKDFVRTVIETNPPEPNGLNGFFKSNVIVTLKGETNTGENVTTYYKMDDSSYKVYSEPLAITEGTHTVSFYSETKNLKEEERSVTFKVDTTAPSFKTNMKELNYTYESKVTISGSLSENGQVYMNGEALPLSSDLSFSKEVTLSEGANHFVLRAVDLAGNYSEMLISIVMDTTTPVLTIESPKSNLQTFRGKGIEVKGSVYPENCLILVNNKLIDVSSDGSFDYVIDPGDLKLVPVNIKAIYLLTGKTTEQKFIVMFEKDNSIKLQVGSKNIIVFGEEKAMDVEPFIDKGSGRTLIPVRFVSEALGFEVNYDTKTKQVLLQKGNLKIELVIGSKVAFVNGVKKNLDVAPIIKDSRTFVPLRFITEAMSYKVDWDATTKTITITP